MVIIDEVVAGIQVPIMLQGKGCATSDGVGANAGRFTIPIRQGHIEGLYEDVADVALHPFVEHPYHEPTIFAGAH